MPFLFLPAVLAVVIFYAVGVYNNFQTIKTRIRASIQEIGNQLKRQSNLIPNLVESAKGYMKHEKGIFELLTAARKSIDEAVRSGVTEKMVEAQQLLQKALSSFRVIVESNPEIKASEMIAKLMDELRDTADKVMYARRTLIDLSADYNRLLVTIPSNLVAKLFGFKPEEGLKVAEEGEHLEVSAEDTKAPKVSL
ncbi:MAG: LemA family protein [Patescibacteria group bacterium]|nr:LemA family protein [Patescibacteria group bacterium]